MKLLKYSLSSVFIGDSSEVWPPMEELGDAEGLLGGWDAEGDTIVQGEVRGSKGHTF